MSLLTSFLNLFKYEPDIEGNSTFDIDKALNENWDKIDAAIENATNFFYITDDTGTVYKCHEELINGKPVLMYEEEV